MSDTPTGDDRMPTRDRLLGTAPVATLDDWLAVGGGSGLAVARSLSTDELLDRLDESGLRGRGGAGFPTGTKWRGVLATARDDRAAVSVVCNAAEGEPGTYKDRAIIDHNPFAVLEGVLVAMHALGAEQAYVCVKERFTTSLERLVAARDELVEAGWPGAAQVVVVPGPDAYLFGEETGMLEVVEGRLPLPRIMPPYQAGAFATTTNPRPSLVNNVETFAHVTAILANGPDWFRETGTASSPGTTVFTVVGDVSAPGVYELPLGETLRTLLVDIAGADPDRILAVFSGTSNAVITPDMLDTRMDFDAMAQAGTGLGSSGFVVYDTTRCIVRVLTVLQRFLAIESCGQCNPCKLGTNEMWDLLARIDDGRGTPEDLERLVDRTPTITDQARCYLPEGSMMMVGSVLEAYWDSFVAHLGTPCPDPRGLPTPLVSGFDEDTGDVVWSPEQHRGGVVHN